MNTFRMRKYVATLSFAAMSTLVAQSLSAQAASTSATTTTEESQPQVMERFEVTGSYIPYSAEAPAVPITKIGVPEIEATGEGDLLEVLRRAVPQFVGNGNVGSANSSIGGGSTNGGSRLQLRNVDTLVLVNGRRAAFAPVAATGGFDFVDVNAIPVSAVESIEVLKDGASALYGSDAVSGVVNIILKDDFEGVEIGGRYRMSKTLGGGTWEERSGRVIAGAKSGNTTMTVSFDWLRADPLYQNEREFSFSQTGKTSAFPGIFATFGIEGNSPAGTYLLAPGQTPPLDSDANIDDLVAQGIYLRQTAGQPTFASQFNISQFVTLQLGNERRGLTLAVGHQLADNIELFGDLLMAQTDTFLQLAAQPIFGMPFTAANVTDFGIGVGLTDPGHPSNPIDDYAYVRNRFVDFPRRYFNDTQTIHGVVGARGNVGEYYNWEVAANLNRNTQDYRNENVLNRVALSNAIDAGLINMFARVQNPANLAQANIFGVASSKNVSSLNSFDARFVGQVPGILPGGPLGFAIGAETRRETLSARPDAGSYTILDPDSPQYGAPSSWDGATTTDPFSVARWVDGYFAEVRVPIFGRDQNVNGFHVLELDVAARQDRYSDSDDPLVPKVMLRWMPVDDQFVVRATYSESFSAPSLYSLFGATTVGFSEQIVDFEFLDGSINELDQAHARTLTSQPAVAQGFASQLLQPEESKAYNLGFIYSPRGVKGLSFEVNYFKIEQEKISGVESEFDILQDVELEGPASRFASRVRIGGFLGTPITAPGQISETYNAFQTLSPVYVSNFEENFVSAKQDGVDFTVNYDFDVESIGRFNVNLSGMWTNEFSVDGGDGTVDEYVGTSNGRSALNGGSIPRWLANLSTSYSRGSWTAGLSALHYPSMTDSTADEDETDVTRDQHIEAWTRVDGFVSYAFRGRQGLLSHFEGVQLRLGVTNMFDEQPPQGAASWTDHNADTAIYGALGRVWFVDASIKF